MKIRNAVLFIGAGLLLLQSGCQSSPSPQAPSALSQTSQDGSPAPEPAKGIIPSPITLGTLVLAAKEPPEGIRLVDGEHPAQSHPKLFYEAAANPRNLETLTLGALLPSPKDTAAFSLKDTKGAAGTVYLFEYGSDDGPRDTVPFMKSFLWLSDGHPTVEHPTELLVHGRFMLLISFPLGDPAAEWYKQRLRSRFDIPSFRQHPDLGSIVQKLSIAYRNRDFENGIRILDDNAMAVAEWSLGWYLRGEFCAIKEAPLEQERAYRRALELHYSKVDPLEDAIVWASLDGLGMALGIQRKLESSAITLERAVTLAKATGLDKTNPEMTSQSSYNLACTYALMEKYPEALEALRVAIATNPYWREYCRTDKDLAGVLGRKEFKELIEGPAIDLQNAGWDQIVVAGKREGSVNFYLGYSADYFTEAAAAFRKAYGIKANVVVGDSTANFDKVLAEKDLATGTIDCILAGGQNVKTGMDLGLFWGPIKGIIPDSDKLAPFLWELQEGVQTKGHLAPFYRNQSGFLYDPDRVKEPLPQTFAELTAWVEAHPKQFGFCDPGKGGSGQSFVHTVIKELCGGLEKYSGDADVVPSKVADWNLAWEWIRKHKDQLTITSSNGDSIARVNRGELAMTVAWDNGVKAFPRTRMYVPKMGLAGGGDTIGVLKNAQHKAAALVWIAFLTSMEQQLRYCQMLGAYPARTDVVFEGTMLTEKDRANAIAWFPAPYKAYMIAEFTKNVLMK